MEKINITELKDPRIEKYTSLNEKQLRRVYEPGEGLFICENERIIKRALEAGYEAESFFVDETHLVVAEDMCSESEGVPVYVCERNKMKDLVGYSLTGGMLSAMKRKPLTNAGELIESAGKVVILDDIENPTNVGAIFRSAAALGAEAVILTHGCSDPLYRRAARVSMGSVFQIPWTFVAAKELSVLKEKGFITIALALSEDAKSIKDPVLKKEEKRAVILGNEDHGISESLLNMCDHISTIPMSNGIDSLNVAAASAVAFYELF